MFSIVATPIYIPTNSVGGSPFVHILSSICYLFVFFLTYLFIHLFIFGCVESSLLRVGFL